MIIEYDTEFIPNNGLFVKLTTDGNLKNFQFTIKLNNSRKININILKI